MRVVNFNPGPAALPIEVLEKIRNELLDYKGSGMSVMEMSHRGKEFMEIHQSAKKNLRDLMGINENYEILFLQGGASQQFFMLPMNFLSKDRTADYVDTGEWASKAIKEAKPFGPVTVLFSGKETKYVRIPAWNELNLSKDAVYCHITTNNTIYGTQWKDFGKPGKPILAADMSSDFMTRRFDVEKFCYIYAGAQKNLGPSGVTLVIIRKDFAQKALQAGIPTILQYKTHIDNDSLYNTPPCFAIYVLMLMTEWAINKGGIDVMEKECTQRAAMVYSVLDSSKIYTPPVDRGSRSNTNIVFRLPSEDMEKAFLDGAKKEGLVGLKGHRSVGGMRVSNYAAMTMEGMKKLTDYMKTFEKKNG